MGAAGAAVLLLLNVLLVNLNTMDKLTQLDRAGCFNGEAVRAFQGGIIPSPRSTEMAAFIIGPSWSFFVLALLLSTVIAIACLCLSLGRAKSR